MNKSPQSPPRLVISNRGEIARRVMRAARERGYVVAVISTPEDADAPVREEADAVLEVASFLDAGAVVQAASTWGADFLHPGYGFLSENADFAAAVEAAGIQFVGPTPENMRALGGKESAKAFAAKLGVPTLNALLSHEMGQGKTTEDREKAPAAWLPLLEARGIVPPYLVKASGGGGGKGMRVVETFAELPAAIYRASQEAAAGFGDPTVFVERYLSEPRHIEIQVFGDGQGGGVFLGERECSLQRRHQKVIEEAPSSVVDAELRSRMGKAALALVRETRYRGAGTVEFLLTAEGDFFFLEMNTRLQVEHPVTEAVFDVDLVQAQLALAEGKWPSELGRPDVFTVPIPRGVSLEARILAENPRADFLPTPGPLVRYLEPTSVASSHATLGVPGGTVRAGAVTVRVDSGVVEGGRVNASFDSMIAKLIVHAPTRAAAVVALRESLSRYVIHGCTTNIPFLLSLAEHPDFLAGRESTGWIARRLERLNATRLPAALLEVLETRAARESLANALGGGEPAGAPVCGLLSAGERFVSAGQRAARSRGASTGPSPGLSAGASPSALCGRDVRFVRTGDSSRGHFWLGGAAVQEVLVSLNEDTSDNFCPELLAARARALAAMKASRQSFDGKSRLSESEWLPVFATRLSREKLALTLFGEVVELPCPRFEKVAGQASSDATRELRAPMAGKVLSVDVGKGTVLKAGDLAFVVESMKMQLEVRVSEGCVVEEVLVEQGQSLSGPDVLAFLAPLTANPLSSSEVNSKTNNGPDESMPKERGNPTR